MTTNINLDEEEFLRDISTFPAWAKSGDDLMTFCRHLQYRLFQSKNRNNLYERKLNLSDEEHAEINRIDLQYDNAYENDASELKPFKEVFGD